MASRFSIPIKGSYDLGLIDRIEANHRVYRRKLVFSTRLHRQDTWQMRLPGMHGRAIIDYWPHGEKDEMHLEPVEIKDGKLTYLRHPTTAILSMETGTLDEYVDRCYEAASDSRLYCAIYIYVQ